MELLALVVSTDQAGLFYAPMRSVRDRHVLVQPCVEGPNALACSLQEQIDTAKQFGMKPLYAVRARSKRRDA